MTAPRIPRVPESRRFGTDPDSRPPMRPRDAYLAIIAVVAACLGAISLVSAGVTIVSHAMPAAKEAIAAEDAKRSASGSVERAPK